MIKNERQYRVTKAEAARFRQALQTFRNRDTDETHPVLRDAQEAAMTSQLAERLGVKEQQVQRYESTNYA